MKPAAYNDTRILLHEEADERPGEAWGVVLAGDYTAEHEHGITSLLSRFGIEEKGIMLEGRSMADGGRELKIVSGSKTETHFVPAPTAKNSNRQARKKAVSKIDGLSTYGHHEKLSDILDRNMRYDFEKDITGAWDNRDFSLVAWTKEAKTFLKDLVDAFAAGDVAMWLGSAGNNPFARDGLVIAIASRIPEKGKATLNERDDNARLLTEAVEKTGIKDLLRKAVEQGKIQSQPWLEYPWHALGPAWTRPEDGSKYPVKFFLNPGNQALYNHGWFTVEQLKEWAKGKGPVIKQKEAA